MNVQQRARVFNEEQIRGRIRQEVDAGNVRRIAREARVAPGTIYAFIRDVEPVSPHNDTLKKFGEWLERPQPPESFWDGVEYAAEMMSETVTRLLRERRLAKGEAIPIRPDAIDDAPRPTTVRERAGRLAAEAQARVAAERESAQPQKRPAAQRTQKSRDP
jgi:AcrR family transcriptional regulator